MANRFKLVLLTALLLGMMQANASNSPLSVNFLPPIQFPSGDFQIRGLRLSVLWGSETEMYGLDVGAIGNVTTTAFGGAAIAGAFNLNYSAADIYILQVAGLANINLGATNIYGLQVTAGTNHNGADANVYGMQLAPINLCTQTKVYGFQIGLYNRADTITGFQIGFINVTKNLHGLQIGFLNFDETGMFQVSPFLNVGF